MLLQKEKTCCFTGHRLNKISNDEYTIKSLLSSEIKKAIADGFTYFISGMAMGFDIWAAETVIDISEEYPDIKLICAIPYRDFGKVRKSSEKERYYNILKKAPYIYVTSPVFDYSCFQFRNIWMVDHSKRVIAAFNGQDGGTKNTVKYAAKTGTEIINILKQQ